MGDVASYGPCAHFGPGTIGLGTPNQIRVKPGTTPKMQPRGPACVSQKLRSRNRFLSCPRVWNSSGSQGPTFRRPWFSFLDPEKLPEKPSAILATAQTPRAFGLLEAAFVRRPPAISTAGAQRELKIDYAPALPQGVYYAILLTKPQFSQG